MNGQLTAAQFPSHSIGIEISFFGFSNSKIFSFFSISDFFILKSTNGAFTFLQLISPIQGASIRARRFISFSSALNSLTSWTYITLLYSLVYSMLPGAYINFEWFSTTKNQFWSLYWINFWRICSYDCHIETIQSKRYILYVTYYM